jgi:phosphatidate phosphatase APP1
MINQGIVRTGVADSDTHSRNGTAIPRSMVASPTDAPGALAAIADTLSGNVNDGRVVGTNAPMVRVTTFAASTGQTGGLALGQVRTIATTDGNVDVTVEIQSPPGRSSTASNTM